MMQAKEVCRMAGITRRTLHFYNERGIVCPSQRTGAGYGLYSDEDVERLFCIRYYLAMGFSLDSSVKFIDGDLGPTRDELAAEIKKLEADIEQKKKILNCLKLEKLTGLRLFPSFEEGEPFGQWLDRMVEVNAMPYDRAEGKGSNERVKALDKSLRTSLSKIAAMRRRGYVVDSEEVMKLVDASRMIADDAAPLFLKPEELSKDAGLKIVSMIGKLIADRDCDSDMSRLFKPESAAFIAEAIDHYCEIKGGGFVMNDEGELVVKESAKEGGGE